MTQLCKDGLLLWYMLALVTMDILARLKASWLQTWTVCQEAVIAQNSLTELLIKFSSINCI